MNADGSPGVAVDTDVGAKAGVIGPLTAVLLAIGTLLMLGAVALIVAGAHGTAEKAAVPQQPSATPMPTEAIAGLDPPPPSPVAVSARLDPDLSNWMWLVKWFLAIPHYIILFFARIAFSVLTVVAFFAILSTGRYPRRIFDFNVGVIRWTWRVSYYATTGGIGTDRYPPFSFGEEPDYPATLSIAYPGALSRGLVLVKWWLLAISHCVIVSIIVGGVAASWTFRDESGARVEQAGGIGLLGALVLIAGVILLFTSRYPRALFASIIGLNRWSYRVLAYAALMTDEYPPFRLDQGGMEPAPLLPDDHPTTSTGDTARVAATLDA